MTRIKLRQAGNQQNMPAELWDSAFMRACRGEAAPHTPIWLMRQAGRYMAEYREVRADHTFLEMCQPELAARVTLDALHKIGADAAIIFADILLILQGLGQDLAFVKGEGPQLSPPIRSPADVATLGDAAAAAASCAYVAEACGITRGKLPAGVPLIGFSGAPFTVASYAIEGAGSRQFANTRTFMYHHPEAWNELLAKLVDALVPYLTAQVTAGAQALQIFDSWVGVLDERTYCEFVQPHVARLIEQLPGGVPVIYFGTNTTHLLPAMVATGPDVIGMDHVVDLVAEWDSLGGPDAISVQGNLDPALLLAPTERVIAGADRILDAVGDRAGHIFNLGHGIFKETDVNNVIALIDHVHQRSAR